MELDRGARFREKAVRMVTRVSRGERLSLLMGASDLISLRRVQARPVLPVVGKVPVAYGRARAKCGLQVAGTDTRGLGRCGIPGEPGAALGVSQSTTGPAT